MAHRFTLSIEKKILEEVLKEFREKHRVIRDPILVVRQYSNPVDQEIVGLFCALFAYGRVGQVLKTLSHITEWLGNDPKHTLKKLIRETKPPFDFCHRFNNEWDLFFVAKNVAKLMDQFGSIGSFVQEKFKQTTLKDSIQALAERLLLYDKSLEPAFLKRKRSLFFLVPEPQRGSTCKRLNLYFRWLVRPKDGVDLGQWTFIPPSVLYLPMDAHLLFASRWFGWTTHKQPTWRTVESVSDHLRKIDSDDPIKYDFSLCQLGIQSSLRPFFEKLLQRESLRKRVEYAQVER